MDSKSKKAILKARKEFSSYYHAFSLKDDSDPYFSRSGCDICNISDNACGGAGEVYAVVFLDQGDTSKQVFDVLEGRLCGSCLCSMINGDDSDLD